MRIKDLLTLVMFFAVGPAMAQGTLSIVNDTAVHIGKLDNGLTYYVRNNNHPEHQANFYIAQRVGSIQEEESQRGLAHFLEHMCFNGTKHFPGNSLIRYLESIGVQFGSNLNAYTSIDQTVYRICNVPTMRVTALDSCLLIIRDWAGDLTLDPKEIDNERGVIHEEWRMRTNAELRMYERNLPKIYSGSKYGVRFPIGLMSVVDNFKYKELEDYYHKWYRPDNQAIIVVGDIDVNHTIAKIKELFGNEAMPQNPAKVTEEIVPDNLEPIFIIDKDKEEQYSTIDAMFKHDAYPDSLKNGLTYLINQFAKQIVCDMLNDRLDEIALRPECPFISASCSDGKYIYSKTKDAFDIYAKPKEGKNEDAIAAAYREVMRARLFGFTETEYQRAKAQYLSSLEKSYTNRNKRENSTFGNMYRDHFLNNEPIPSLEVRYAAMSRIVPMIPLDAINISIKRMIGDNDSNLVVVNFNQEREGAVYPTAKSLKEALDGVRTEKLSAYIDNVKDEPLIAKLPRSGSITNERVNKKFDCKELDLSNGAKVILKKTNFKDNEIILCSSAKGGSSLLDEKDFANINVFNSTISNSGLGNFSRNELHKALKDKNANINLSLDIFHDKVYGYCTPKDITTMFQLLYLSFTNIKKDEAAFQNAMENLKVNLKNQSASADFACADSVNATRYNHNPRFATLKTEDLAKIDYRRILEIAKKHYSNAGKFTFILCGNFNEENIRPLICQYIASLPSTGEKGNYRNIPLCTKGNRTNYFTRQMETPKAKIVMYWEDPRVPYTVQNQITADVVGQLLRMIYVKKIREEVSAAYSVAANGYLDKHGDEDVASIIVTCPVKPEKCDTALTIIRNEMKELGRHVDSDMLTKIKEFLLKRADEYAKKNTYWENVLTDYYDFGVDFYTNYKAAVQALTPQAISDFVNDYILKPGNHTEVVMKPETTGNNQSK
jgi:zinc protease